MSVRMFNPPTTTPTPNSEPQDRNPIFLSIRHGRSSTTRKLSHQIYTSPHWSSVWAKQSYWSETSLILLVKNLQQGLNSSSPLFFSYPYRYATIICIDFISHCPGSGLRFGGFAETVSYTQTDTSFSPSKVNQLSCYSKLWCQLTQEFEILLILNVIYSHFVFSS